MDDRKSTTQNLFNYGSSAISWISKKQNIVSLPSTEEEYKAVSAGHEAVWFRRILHNLKLESTNYHLFR